MITHSKSRIINQTQMTSFLFTHWLQMKLASNLSNASVRLELNEFLFLKMLLDIIILVNTIIGYLRKETGNCIMVTVTS